MMKKNVSFSVKSRGRSIRFAIEGVKTFFKAEHNARVHLLCTLLVAPLAFITNVSKSEIICLVIVTGFVWCAELFNTAIERTIDFVSKERRLEIKYIKDMSAAAVLIASVTALVTGCLIFIPKLF